MAAAPPHTVILAGATGRCGVFAVRHLLAQRVHVAALVRNQQKAENTFAAELKLAQDNGVSLRFVHCDVTKPDTVNAALDQKFDPPALSVVSVLGATSFLFGDDTPDKIDFQGVATLVDATKRAGIGGFVLMSSVSITKWWAPISLLGLSKWKLAGENHLRKSGLDYIIVRPPRLINDAGGKLPVWVRQGDTFPIVGRFMSRDDASRACVHALNRLLQIRQANGGPVKITFECTSVNSVPQPGDAGSQYASNPVDSQEWNNLIERLQPDA